MSWKKKRKKIRNTKHKVTLFVGLMFTAVLGLLIILCFKIFNQGDYYKIDSRVENLKNTTPIEGSGYKAVAWLKIQGTDIDLPIVHSDDLGEDFPVQLENFGWTLDSMEDNKYYNIIGHNIFNLSATPKIKSKYFHRFEQLMAFTYYDFAKDNEYIQLTVGEKDYVYKIFAVTMLDHLYMSYLPLTNHPKDYEIKLTKEVIEKKNIYKYDVDVNEDDKIISLSTCTRFYGPNEKTGFYIFGRLLRDGEKMDHYRVTKSDKYKDIEKKLKGDEKNE